LEKLERIHKRQLARFLNHLNKTGQLSPGLESDIKRVFGYLFEDISNAVNGHDKERDFGRNSEQ